jgi:iron(III) transport system permease protein
MLAASVGLYVLGKFVFGRQVEAASSKATVQTEYKQLGLVGTTLAWLAFGLVIFVALLPHIGVVLSAVAERWTDTIVPEQYTLKYLATVITSEETYTSILNSLRYAAVATGADLVVGFAVAWLVVRARVRGRNVLDGLAMLPLAVPGLILAAGYVALTARGALKAIGPAGNPFVILVVAYAVRRLPFVVRGASAGLQQVPESLEDAARTLGASRAAAAWRITLPLIAANIIAAGVLTFAFAMLEVSDSLILAQTERHYPITKQIYTLATSAGSPETPRQAAALGVYGMGLLGGTLAAAAALLGRRLGAIFRA